MTAQVTEVEALKQLVRDRNVTALCKGLFGFAPTAKQEEIIRTIAFQEHDQVVITAPTRYGKTQSLAIGIALRFVLGRDLTVNQIAPVQKQTKNFRKYLLECAAVCDLLNVADTRGQTAEELMKEANQHHIDFTDNNEINFLTAGGVDDAKGQMGEGADIVIVDESCDVTDDVYEKRIFRQAEVSADKAWSLEIHIGNPWVKTNHFYEHWTDPTFKRIHVTLDDALNEGRVTEGKIEKARRRLSPSRFTVLYEANFPDSFEDALIPSKYIEEARGRSFDWGSIAENYEDMKANLRIGYGFDVAGEGEDQIVLTRVEKFRDKWRQTHLWDRHKSSDTGELAEWAHRHITNVDRPEKVVCVVDYVGIGAGVWSKLRELGVNSIKFKAGEKPTREKDEHANKKAQYYMRLRDLFEEGDIDIMDDAPKELYVQLTTIKNDPTRREKNRIVDPAGGSPDHADALMMALAMDSGIYIGGLGGSK